MKLLLVFITSAAVAVGTWQRHTLMGLRAEAERIAAESRTADILADPPPGEEPEPQVAVAPVVTESEVAALTSVFLAVKPEDGFATDLGIRVTGGGPPSHPEICEPLSRFTTAQIRAVVEAWPAKPDLGQDRDWKIKTFLRLAGRVNPEATVPLIYEFLNEPKGIRVSEGWAGEAFKTWLGHDPEGLLAWAQQAGTPEGFGGTCATWADAALVVRDPSMENVRKLLTHKTYASWQSPFTEVARTLQSPEARMMFLRNLHAATGGIHEDLGSIVTVLTERTPFARLAYLADAEPAFQPSKAERDNGGSTERPQDQVRSLRFEIAVHSRDGTAAQRWEWLTQRPEDHPSDKLFGHLVDAWCKNDYGDTAAWIRGLPPGSDRDTAKKKVIAYLEHHGGGDLVREWESP